MLKTLLTTAAFLAFVTVVARSEDGPVTIPPEVAKTADEVADANVSADILNDKSGFPSVVKFTNEGPTVQINSLTVNMRTDPACRFTQYKGPGSAQLAWMSDATKEKGFVSTPGPVMQMGDTIDVPAQALFNRTKCGAALIRIDVEFDQGRSLFWTWETASPTAK